MGPRERKETLHGEEALMTMVINKIHLLSLSWNIVLAFIKNKQ